MIAILKIGVVLAYVLAFIVGYHWLGEKIDRKLNQHEWLSKAHNRWSALESVYLGIGLTWCMTFALLMIWAVN